MHHCYFQESTYINFLFDIPSLVIYNTYHATKKLHQTLEVAMQNSKIKESVDIDLI